MKKKPIILSGLLAVLFILNIGCTVSAQNYNLSPALELISESINLSKCTVTTRDVKFSRNDFEETLGRPIEYITVTSLPSSSVGHLKYAGSDVQEGQTIPAGNLGLLKFTPARTEGNTSFEFCADGETDFTVSCTMNVTGKQNYAPHVQDVLAEAVAGIGLVKTLDVYDPDGDSVQVEIAEYPEKGIVKLTSNGFVYTSLPNIQGNDSFSYRVLDKYGNASEKASVTINVRKPLTDIRYSDMAGHWGYTSAIAMTELGLMDGEEKDGRICFNPDTPVSRGDFLAMAMICAGLEKDIKLGAVTTFADDSDIPSNIKSYASYAEAGGIINGYIDVNGNSVFAGKEEITRAEAAKVLSNIIGRAKSAQIFDFVDVASIPTWARDSFASLVGMGIINGSPEGTLEPGKTLTRAEAAQLLCNTVDYLKGVRA